MQYSGSRIWKLIIALFFVVGISSYQYTVAQPYRAQDLQKSWPRYSLELGGYLTNMNSSMRLGFDNIGLGVNINFEEALGLNTTSVTFRGQFLYRFSKNRKSALRASYFQIYRGADKTLETDIEIGENLFTAGTTISTKFNISVIKVDYSYSFLLDERLNINASFGFFILPSRISVIQDDEKSSVTNFVAPLPALGLSTQFYLSPKFLLKQRLNLFYLVLDNFEGSMTDIHVLLEYRPWQHFGFGIGYNTFNVNVEAKKSGGVLVGDLVGNVGYKHSGLMFYMVTFF